MIVRFIMYLLLRMRTAMKHIMLLCRSKIIKITGPGDRLQRLSVMAQLRRHIPLLSAHRHKPMTWTVYLSDKRHTVLHAIVSPSVPGRKQTATILRRSGIRPPRSGIAVWPSATMLGRRVSTIRLSGQGPLSVWKIPWLSG